MSGFSPEWLALREPVDHRSRDAALAGAVAAAMAGRPVLRITDLGCGTGSNLRALAPILGRTQEWMLVDHDARLLDAARERLRDWAEEAAEDGDDLRLRLGERDLRVIFRQADLVGGLEAVLDRPADLVTAAALFDLVSEAWIARFVAALADRTLPLYTVLTYDGEESRSPAHPADAAIFGAFHRHQATDKGFGPSAGPRAAGIMAAAFSAAGYAVRTAAAPWRLSVPDDLALMRALSEGIASAVRETGTVAEDLVRDWRTSGTTAHSVGHVDLWAVPGS
jgi:SAM-dependent methyltransferase